MTVPPTDNEILNTAASAILLGDTLADARLHNHAEALYCPNRPISDTNLTFIRGIGTTVAELVAEIRRTRGI